MTKMREESGEPKLYEMLENLNGPEDLKGLSDMQQRVLAREVRHVLVDTVSRTGGHLASNLGVVELTIALHSVYESPRDRIIWDVGHQAYVHKLLTGRYGNFGTLRQFGGISGFPRIDESPHDVFGAGHSSTSISAALGIAAARDLEGEDYSVVAVIGDGAMTGGMAFEALNHAGHLEKDITVVLNENEMSIAKNVGSLSKYLSRVRTHPRYSRVKEDIEGIIKRIPAVGSSMAKVAGKAKDSIKYFLVPSMLFEELGFTYLGPIDGHDLPVLKDVLKRTKKLKGPVLIHVVTKKGKGYRPALDNPDTFHGVGCFNKETGEIIVNGSGQSYSSAFGKAMLELAGEDPKLVALTAAMAAGTGLSGFAKAYPDRFFDVAIAEQHAVTYAAGLARSGFRPVFAVYSTFLQRAYDQIIHDVCLQNLPVVFAVDRAGIVGQDGPTHHGAFDLSYLSHIPNMQVLAPCCCAEIKDMLKYALNSEGPVAIRYPRGEGQPVRGYTPGPLEKGKSEIVQKGKDLFIIAVGNMLSRACRVADQLGKRGIKAGVVNARFVKPVDTGMLADILKDCDRIAVLEDNVIRGGYGSYLLEYINSMGFNTMDIKIKLLGLPDEFVTYGDAESLYRAYGLDDEGIYYSLLELAEGGRTSGIKKEKVGYTPGRQRAVSKQRKG
ncbi:MAG: 1-deoxy-D-xylulose-5-phosphate synthase [Bacillota bacterium]|nr:1-deoxy-D-xylulose-5-phosphate synthase [Bacillota bacterium]MDD3298689.1 1-deoxy-D-xylulose-5-phosphate synthase [Bacillota bacterium]MDD3850536.1 1-deoxy-D-xylulose-5-phosphate synthase [Bacillota bacterium]MDD4707666.1 1-deoxy-D-xylulose-5-phosphate synthase [Bacillota bacterium]